MSTAAVCIFKGICLEFFSKSLCAFRSLLCAFARTDAVISRKGAKENSGAQRDEVVLGI
jgi:hypothetical protein